MKIFHDEFISFLKRTLICSLRGHKSGNWVEVYWAPAHSADYKAKFCEICSMQLATTKPHFPKILNSSRRTYPW